MPMGGPGTTYEQSIETHGMPTDCLRVTHGKSTGYPWALR